MPGRPIIWIIEGQKPTVFAVGADGVFGYFFSVFAFFIFLEQGPI